MPPTKKDIAAATDTAVPGTPDDRLADIAEKSLDFFEHAAGAAREALGEDRRPGMNVFAVVNTLTADKAVRNLEIINAENRRELRVLSTEPAIARIVVEDEQRKQKTYFISRATPHAKPRDGSACASYRAPIGRLASLPVGGDLDVKTSAGVVNLQVIERALLRPSDKDGEWDSVNSAVQGESYGPLTITSLREFLRLRGMTADEADLLEAALAEDRAAGVVAEGLRRNAITKMELRDQAILDEYQDEIFRLPLDTRLVILGPPGTGKTTTLIKRLGLKLDHEYLTDDEKELVATTAAGSARHAQSWIMFTPTDLLRQYVKEAFARENIPASDERISTWDDFRRDVARHRLGILRSGAGGGIFVMKDDVPSLQGTTLARQRDWFADFDGWQSEYFWNDLRTNAQALSAHKDSAIARLGAQLLETLPAALSMTQSPRSQNAPLVRLYPPTTGGAFAMRRAFIQVCRLCCAKPVRATCSVSPTIRAGLDSTKSRRTGFASNSKPPCPSRIPRLATKSRSSTMSIRNGVAGFGRNSERAPTRWPLGHSDGLRKRPRPRSAAPRLKPLRQTMYPTAGVATVRRWRRSVV
jgi:hypothetical protein